MQRSASIIDAFRSLHGDIVGMSESNNARKICEKYDCVF